MDIQARIPAALAALHNFILQHDPTEVQDSDTSNEGDPNPGFSYEENEFGELARGPAREVEKRRAQVKRDLIAQQMWDSYQNLLQEQGEELE